MKRVYGIIGWPVWHTRSPAMHAAAFEATGVDATYVAFAVPPDGLEDAIRGLAALGIRGVNVTVPHKERVVPLLDEVDDEARAIGAVNTISLERGRLLGSNTDASGFVRALAEAGFDPQGVNAIIIGAGGAARAAVAGLARAGAAKITVAARRQAQAETLIGDVDTLGLDAELEAFALEKTPERAFKEARLLIQATSATLDDGPEAHLFAASLPLQLLPKSAMVTDVVYTPRHTTVLARAETLGLATLDGLGMLLHQGAITFERWTGKPAPLEAMRTALE
jgi:shikimate dehydrogenase